MQTIDSDIKALQSEMGQLRKDIAEIAETLRKTLHDSRQEASRQVWQASDRLAENAGKAAHIIAHRIEEKPVTITLATGVTLAAALGLLLCARQH